MHLQRDHLPTREALPEGRLLRLIHSYLPGDVFFKLARAVAARSGTPTLQVA
jgi:hypothetical protein